MEKKQKKKPRRLRVMGVMGGNGVILHPFKRYLMGNIEFRSAFKTKSNLQWYLNFQKHPFVDDLMVAKFLFKKPDVIMGAPDCGHSSILTVSSTGKMKNPIENESVRTFFESINEYQPKVWLMENLPAIMNTITMNDFKKNFPNYRFVFHTLSVMEFGNSQKTRKRLVVIGIKRGIEGESDIFMNMNDVYQVNEPRKVKELISDLKDDNFDLCNIREPEDKQVKMGKEKLSFGEIQKKWNKELKGEKYWPLGGKGSTAPNIPGVYRLKDTGTPATVRRDPRQFRPDGKPLSPREIARIQGVPDDFKLFLEADHPKGIEYALNKARTTVAKGAPYEIGLWFYKQLMKCKKHLT